MCGSLGEPVSAELLLRRKQTFRASDGQGHDRQIVLVKRPYETAEHVLMKALLWALYLPQYPNLMVEVAIDDRYKPDLLALGDDNRPRFWGEAGEVSQTKIRSLGRRYRATHLAICKWNTPLSAVLPFVQGALEGLPRAAPCDVLSFAADSEARWIDAQGHISISWAEVIWMRLAPHTTTLR